MSVLFIGIDIITNNHILYPDVTFSYLRHPDNKGTYDHYNKRDVILFR